MGSKEKEDTIYLVMKDLDLPSEIIHTIKQYVGLEDWKIRNKDYYEYEMYDINIVKYLRVRNRRRSFSWPYYNY